MNRFNSKRKNRGICYRFDHGFTLLEILVVITILALLGTMATPLYLKRLDKAKGVKAAIQLEQIRLGLQTFRLDNGFYPETSQGLDALLKRPVIGREPCCYRTNGYLEEEATLTDPWGRKFIYFIDDHDSNKYHLKSLGADGTPGGTGKNEDKEL